MNINQENYEQYFLDYLEGTLSGEMEKELMLFLESHPDLKALLEGMDPLPSLARCEPGNPVHKNKLKKDVAATENIREDNIDDWLVSELEGLLDGEQQHELEEFLTLNPAYEYDRGKYKQVIFYPDQGITFMRKEGLKRKSRVLFMKRVGWFSTAAAALLLLFFGIRFLLMEDKGTPSQLAGTPSPVEQSVTPSQSDTYQASEGTPSQNPGTLSQETLSQSDFQANVNRTPTLITGTPSRVNRIKTLATASITLEPDDNDKSLEKNNLHESISFEFPEEKEKSLLAKVFASFASRAKEGFKNQVRVDENLAPDFNFWNIARAGIQGYNSIADREVELFVHRDAEGKVSSYALVEHDQLIMERNLGKN